MLPKVNVVPVQVLLLAGLTLTILSSGCNRSEKETPITGHASDPAVDLKGTWPTAGRYIYRVDHVAYSQVPNRYTSKLIQVETMIGQDLAFSVTNVAADGSRQLRMEVLAVQLETTKNGNVTLSYDSANSVFFLGETSLADSLDKLVGVTLTFHLSPFNRVRKVEGANQLAWLADRKQNPVRGVSKTALVRTFSERFFRDVMGERILPHNPVQVDDAWPLGRPVGPGLFGAALGLNATCALRGWQTRDGTNCVRIDFSGALEPTKKAQARAASVSNVVQRVRVSNNVEAKLTGRSWFNTELSILVEAISDQTVTRKTTHRRKLVSANESNPKPSDLSPPLRPEGSVDSSTNAPQPTLSEPHPIVTKTVHHTALKLVEIQ